MEEDEDFMLENSPLIQYLRESGLGASTTKSPTLTPAKTVEVKQKQLENSVANSVLEAASVIQATNLLFDEDRELVDLLLSNFQDDKREVIRYIFKDTASTVIVLLGLCLFLFFGYFAIVLVSLFYAYKAADYFWLKRRRLRRLKNFVSIVESNFRILCRVIKFLHENENLMKARFHGKNLPKAYETFTNFKEYFLKVQRDVNNAFSDSTVTLINQVPLQDFINSQDSYICCELPDLESTDSVTQLHNLFMLLQSQFLARLTMSMVPKLAKIPAEPVIDKLMVRLASQLREIQKTLSTNFDLISRRGLCLDGSPSLQPLRKKKIKPSNDNMLVMNVHDLSNSLQYSLIKTRELESALDQNQRIDARAELEAIQDELISCCKHIDDILIVHKKLERKEGESSNASQQQEVFDVSVKVTELGLSDLDPKIDDDVFQGVVDDKEEPEQEEIFAIDETDPLAKKKHREIMGELKVRLREKALDWAEREQRVLERKGLFQADMQEVFSLYDQSSNESPEVDFCQRNERRRRKLSICGDALEEDLKEQRKSLLVDKSDLTHALQQARSNFGEKYLNEDCFSGSGENSESEGSIHGDSNKVS